MGSKAHHSSWIVRSPSQNIGTYFWDGSWPSNIPPCHVVDQPRYIISNILLAIQRPLCSMYLLRLTNLVYPIVTLFLVTELLKEIHPRLTRQERFYSAAVIITFPILYFFNFMYYTDGGSAAFVLASWLSAKRGYHLLAALVKELPKEAYCQLRHMDSTSGTYS